MYSKYLNNIQIKEQSREPIRGGLSLTNFLQLDAGIKGGDGKNENSLQKICHLSIPIGLVITPISKGDYKPKYITSISSIDKIEDEIPEPLDDQLFHKLYQSTIYTTTKTKKRNTRKKSRR